MTEVDRMMETLDRFSLEYSAPLCPFLAGRIVEKIARSNARQTAAIAAGDTSGRNRYPAVDE